MPYYDSHMPHLYVLEILVLCVFLVIIIFLHAIMCLHCYTANVFFVIIYIAPRTMLVYLPHAYVKISIVLELLYILSNAVQNFLMSGKLLKTPNNAL